MIQCCSDKCLTFYIEEQEELTFEVEELVVVDHDPYDGPYVVNPTWNDIVLETRNKSMRGNVTVLEIELEKVTNTGGGYTVTIGG